MIIKTFVGDSSTAALKQVRAELGGEAVVLSTRRVPDGQGGYNTEITACLDATAPVSASASASRLVNGARKVTAPKWNRIETKPKSVASVTPPAIRATKNSQNTESTSKIETILRDLDLPIALGASIAASVSDESQLAAVLLAEIRSRVAGFPQLQAGDRLLVIGPAGSGKTTVISKLAAQLVAQNQKVTVTGSCQQKVGSIDELQSMADLIGIHCDETANAVTNPEAITLIDCGSVSVPAEVLAGLNPTHTLFVFSATSRTSDLEKLALAARDLAVSGLCITMLDQTYRLGSLFAVAEILGAPLAIVSTAAIGVNSLVPAEEQMLIDLMLREGAAHA